MYSSVDKQENVATAIRKCEQFCVLYFKRHCAKLCNVCEADCIIRPYLLQQEVALTV
jgi:hypothetical protein